MRNRRLKTIVSKMMSGNVGMHVPDSLVDPDGFKGLSPEGRSPEERADATVRGMSLEEKLAALGGYHSLGFRAIPSAGLPAVWFSDATSGVRSYGKATSFPAGIAMAASWDPGLVAEVAAAIAEEGRHKGVSVLLGPGCNLARVPTCGRDFEYFGEDPFLAARTVVGYVRGLQSKGVIATVKHFCCNNSEVDRHRMNAIVDERTLRELYLPAFEAAVKEGGAGAVMSAYNPVNGVWASENGRLLSGILKGEWGFAGLVMSDWISVYSAKEAFKAGLDLEMPKGAWFSPARLRALLDSGEITEAELDGKLRRILGVFFRAGVYDRPVRDGASPFRDAGHEEVALRLAEGAIALCKNEGGALPLGAGVARIVVTGPLAVGTPRGGGGSCSVNSEGRDSDIFGALHELAPAGCEVVHVPCARGFPKAARGLLASADAVVFCAGYTEVEQSESWDRSWELPEGQAALIRSAAALNPRVVVVAHAGGDFETESWIDAVPAFIHGMYLGQSVGHAVARVILGLANPSGKLPFSMARAYGDYAAVAGYPRTPDATSFKKVAGPKRDRTRAGMVDVRYGEKLLVGYRNFDARGLEPRFPFGHGLSYTRFALSGAGLSAARMVRGGSIEVRAALRNVGDVAGAEVVQLYIADAECSVMRPPKELKGFAKVRLAPGEEAAISFTIDERALSFWDEASGAWKAEGGKFRALLGTSSRAIAAELEFDLEG